MLSPGKRLRPLATLAAAGASRGSTAAAMDVAVAVEYVHAASLVLDDLPSMDDAARRRGRPALHLVHGVATAELDRRRAAGPRIRGRGRLRKLSASARLRATAELAGAVGAAGCCGGQAADLAAEPATTGLDGLESIHARKTGALFVAAVRGGALAGGAPEATISSLTAYARNLGLAFQITDDLLDLEGDAAAMGKDVARDAHRANFATILGPDSCRRLVDELPGRLARGAAAPRPARGGALGPRARRAGAPLVSSAGSASDRPTLEEARSRLRELGYLDAPVERLLFRTVFSGRGGAFFPAVLIGAFAAALSAIAAIAAGEPGCRGIAGDRRRRVPPRLRRGPLSRAAPGLPPVAPRGAQPHAGARGRPSAGLAAAVVVFALWSLGTYGLARGLSARAALGPPSASPRSSSPPPSGSPFSRTRSPAPAPCRAGRPAGCSSRPPRSGCSPRFLFFSRRETAAVPPPQPSPRPAPMVVAAVDGLALDGPLGPPALVALLGRGASGWWPAERVSPPEIWTTLATGVSRGGTASRALSRVRPLGAVRRCARRWGRGGGCGGIEPALGLAVHAPVSSADRQALAFWEVAASAGLRSLSVGWWAAGAWPGAVVIDNRAVLGAANGGEAADRAALQSFDRERAAGFTRDRVSAGLRHRAGRARASRTRRRQGGRVAHAPGETGVARRDRSGRRGRRQPSRARRPGTDGRVRRSGGAPDACGSARSTRRRRSSPGWAFPGRADLDGAPVASLFAARTVEETSVPSYGAQSRARGLGRARERSRVSGEAEEPGVS